MSIDRIRLYVSPLSDQIMIGRIGKRPGIALERRDATSEFIGAIIEWTPPGCIRMVEDGSGKRYEIEVREVER